MIYTISLCLILIFLVIQKFKIWSPIFFFSFYLFLQILLYYLFINDFVPNNAYYMLPIPYDLIGFQINKTLFFYTIIILFFLIFTFFKKKEPVVPTAEGIQILNELSNAIPRKGLTLSSIFIFIWSMIYAFDVKWSIILEHQEYLAATSQKVLDLNNIFSVVYNNSLLFLITFTMFSFFLCSKKKYNFEKYLFFIISVFIFLLIISRGSRSAVFIFIFYAFGEALILEKKVRVWKVLLYLILSVQMFTSSIAIRGADSGGLVNIIPIFFDYTRFNLTDNLFFIYQNTSFGVLNFDIGLNYNPDYSVIHKFLSNSPLLSIIDGFREISQERIFRITVYTPFNSYIEAYHFGPIFLIYFCALQFSNIIWVSNKLNSYGFIYYLPSVIFCYLSIIYSTQYSVRTTTKYIFLSYLFLFIANYYLKKFIKQKTNI